MVAVVRSCQRYATFLRHSTMRAYTDHIDEGCGEERRKDCTRYNIWRLLVVCYELGRRERALLRMRSIVIPVDQTHGPQTVPIYLPKSVPKVPMYLQDYLVLCTHRRTTIMCTYYYFASSLSALFFISSELTLEMSLSFETQRMKGIDRQY